MHAGGVCSLYYPPQGQREMIYAVESESFAIFLTWPCQRQRMQDAAFFDNDASVHDCG